MPTAAELQIVIEAQDRASAQLQAIGQQVARLEQQVDTSTRRAASGGGLAGMLGIGAGFAAAQQAFQAIGGLMGFLGDSVVRLNSDLEQSVATFTALTGSVDRAQAVIAALRREAAQSPFSDAQTIAAGRTLISVTDGTTESLTHLIQVAEQLAALDPAQGLEGAAQALREAASGDFQSIAERFELSRQSIQRFREQGLGNLQAVEAELQRLGITSELVERLGRTFEGRRATIASFFDELRQRLGSGLFERLSDLFGHAVNLIAQYGDRLRQVASDIGATIGAFAERLAGTLVPALTGLLDKLAPGLGGIVRGELQQVPEAVTETARAAQAAVPVVEDLGRTLGRLGVEAAGVQQQADRVKRTYDEQLEPLERQLRLLQQSEDVQRTQNALATNRATVERLRLEREITALQRAAGGNVDPNDPGLTLRQRLIALALQDRQLQVEAIGLEEQRRPAVQTLQSQIQAIQDRQRDALKPLEDTLANYREQIGALKLQYDQLQLNREAAETTATRIREMGTGPASSEALQDSRKRGEALADALLERYRQWIEAGGGTVWGAITTSLQRWYDGGGKQAVARIGQDLGDAMGAAAVDAFRAAVVARLTESFFSTAGVDAVRKWLEERNKPLVQQLGGGPGAGGGGAGGVSVTVAPGAVTVQGRLSQEDADQLVAEHMAGLAESLAAAAAGTDPGPSRFTQGAGR